MDTESKIYWRDKVFKWLEQNGNYHTLDLNDCLEGLKRDEVKCGAAIAAFWNVYLNPNDSFSLDEAQLAKIKQLLQSTSSVISAQSQELKEKIQAKAFVALHLAGIVLISELTPESPSWSEIPSVVEAIEIGLTADSLTPPVEIDISRTWGKDCFSKNLFDFSQILLSGIVSVEASRWLSHQGRHEDAFSLMANRCGYLYLTTIEGEVVLLENEKRFLQVAPGFTPYLPHSRGEFDIQEVVDLFREIKNHRQSVKDWKLIAESCALLQYFGLAEQFYDPWGIVEDGEGRSAVTAVEFWAGAEAFAEQQMSPSEFRQYLEEKERTEAQERLKRDFFDGGLWEVFEDDTRAKLEEAEHHWEKKQFGDMVNDLSMAAQSELPAMFPFLKQALHQAERSELRQMAYLLTVDTMTQASIKGLKLSKGDEGDENFVLEKLPRHLKDLASARVPASHLIPQVAQSKNPQEIRKLWLGINQPGILPHLARIKKLCEKG